MGKKPQIAVLLANTGTPDDPSPEAVRRYLRDYLKDRRIVEMPPFIWLPILYGTVLRKRPAKSAAKYRQIWTPEGSPLVVHARKIAEGLNERMKASDLPVRVEYSMCYGNPSLDAQIRKIVAEGIEKLFILPLFPQYSPQTVGSVMDTVGKTYRTLRNIPATRTVKRFCDRDDWVQAMAQHVRNYWAEHGEPWSEGGKLIFSFHGVPEECVKEKGDTYQQECLDSSKAIAAALNLTSEQWETDFQSRFGPQEWLQPYTIERAKTLVSISSARALPVTALKRMRKSISGSARSMKRPILQAIFTTFPVLTARRVPLIFMKDSSGMSFRAGYKGLTLM